MFDLTIFRGNHVALGNNSWRQVIPGWLAHGDRTISFEKFEVNQVSSPYDLLSSAAGSSVGPKVRAM